MSEPTEAKAVTLALAAADRRAERPVVLDVRQLTPICDYFVICSGRSLVHTKAIAEHVEETAIGAGWRPRFREGYADAKWIVLDFGDVVTHVFSAEGRDYYDLDRLWRDARLVSLPTEATIQN